MQQPTHKISCILAITNSESVAIATVHIMVAWTKAISRPACTWFKNVLYTLREVQCGIIFVDI